MHLRMSPTKMRLHAPIICRIIQSWIILLSLSFANLVNGTNLTLRLNSARLTKGSRHSGVLQMSSSRMSWQYVCADNIGVRQATMACAEMDLPTGNTTTWIDSKSSNVPSVTLTCDDTANLLSQCHVRQVDKCMTGVIGVTCNDKMKTITKRSQSEDGDVRLVGPGVIEIYHDNKWGSVCNENFDYNAGKVVCRQLGYENYAVKMQSIIGVSFGPIWLQFFTCKGDEQRLVECDIKWGIDKWDYCVHAQDVAIKCLVNETDTGILITDPPPTGKEWLDLTIGVVILLLVIAIIIASMFRYKRYVKKRYLREQERRGNIRNMITIGGSCVLSRPLSLIKADGQDGVELVDKSSNKQTKRNKFALICDFFQDKSASDYSVNDTDEVKCLAGDFKSKKRFVNKTHYDDIAKSNSIDGVCNSETIETSQM